MLESRGLLVAISVMAVAFPCASGVAVDCNLSTPPAQTADPPDDSFEDANGDGIDGMRCGPIFVSPAGSDENPGSIEAPMKSLGAAILAAKALTPVRSVYVSNSGTYAESLVFQDGVSVHGGYDHTNGWSRSDFKSPVLGGSTAAWVSGFTKPTMIDRLSITAAPGVASGGNSIGLVIRNNSAPLTLNLLSITSGVGQPGNSGAHIGDGDSGNDGASGFNGSCDGAGPGGAGGPPADLPLSSRGGMGGRGGSEGAYPGLRGNAGIGPNPGLGGAGGSGGNPGRDGAAGGKGGSGAPGVPGAGGTGFGVPGSSGTDGGDGSGGGGGGGGGGQGCFFCDDGQGNGGGGGASGGLGGRGGTGGDAGGSSYAILSVGSELILAGPQLTTGVGANGGDGGAGGTAGLGGMGGPGAQSCTNEVGAGGRGGDGGDGAAGGHGGGGSGGNSIALLEEAGASSTLANGTLTVGAAGLGGRGPGIHGADGISSLVYSRPGTTTLSPLNPPLAVHARIVTTMNQFSAPTPFLVADPDAGASYTVEILSAPAHGLANVEASTLLRYTPEAGFQGYDSFMIRATEAGGAGLFIEGFAVVAVTCPITINQQPDAVIVTVNESVEFTVAATGDGTLSYQWRKDMVDLADEGTRLGSQTARLSISSAQPSDAGLYDVVVSNNCGFVTSDRASLLVNPAPNRVARFWDLYE